MWTTILLWASGVFSNMKNIIIGVLCLGILASGVYAWIKGKQVDERDKTIEKQQIEIRAKDAEIQTQREQISVMEANLHNIRAAQVAMQRVQDANRKLRTQIAKLSKEKDNGQEAQVYRDMFEFFASSGMSGDVSDNEAR